MRWRRDKEEKERSEKGSRSRRRSRRKFCFVSPGATSRSTTYMGLGGK